VPCTNDGAVRPTGSRRVEAVPTTLTLRDRLHRARRGWPAGYPVAQFPNAPLLVALAGWLVASLTDGSVHAYARGVFYAGFAAWAWGELASGVNLVRRAIGAAGLVYVVVKVGQRLDS
jgi:hypothetical protein